MSPETAIKVGFCIRNDWCTHLLAFLQLCCEQVPQPVLFVIIKPHAAKLRVCVSTRVLDLSRLLMADTTHYEAFRQASCGRFKACLDCSSFYGHATGFFVTAKVLSRVTYCQQNYQAVAGMCRL